MQRYPAHFVNQARRLASDNLSYGEISRKLNIPNRTIADWCQGLVKGSNTNSTIRTHQARRKRYLYSEKKVFCNQIINRDMAKIYCGILYGCEGSKYPASNGIALTNSDPDLINAFITLFRKAFLVDEQKWRVHLQIHTTHDYEKLTDYWSTLLNIPKNKFYKPTLTEPHGRKHRSEYLGTCTLKYFNYRFQLKLIGIFEEFMRKSTCLGASHSLVQCERLLTS